MRVPTEVCCIKEERGENKSIVPYRKAKQNFTVKVPKRKALKVTVEHLKAGQPLKVQKMPCDTQLRKMLEEHVVGGVTQIDICVIGTSLGNGAFHEVYQLKPDVPGATMQETADVALSVSTILLLQEQMVETVDLPDKCDILPICYEGEMCVRDMFGMMCNRYIVAPIAKVTEVIQYKLNAGNSSSVELEALQKDLQSLSAMA